MASTHAHARSAWSGKWAFILAAAASAVGLGNMWRFPYLAAKYGGGTFLLTYLVLVFTFGVSLLLLETALGRKTGQSAIGAFKQFGKKYAFIGILASTVPFIITPYYCIIGGWVTKYAAAYLINGPEALADGGDFFTGFISSNTESFLWMLLFMAVVFIVVSLGVKGGIEKANLVMMPALIIMAVGIALYTLTMPGAVDGGPVLPHARLQQVLTGAGHRRARADVLQPVAGHGHHDHVRLLPGQEVQPHAERRPHRRLRHRRVVPRRPHDRAGRVRGHGLGRGRGGQLRSVAHVRHPAHRVRRHGRRGHRRGLPVLPAGTVRSFDQRHFADRNLHLHRAGRCGLVAQKRRCAPSSAWSRWPASS